MERPLVKPAVGRSRVRTKNGRMYLKTIVPMASNCMRGGSIRRERAARFERQRNKWGSQTLNRGETGPRVGQEFNNLWERRGRRNRRRQE
jgi:hypothetical protein